jgi:hypothetical protein
MRRDAHEFIRRFLLHTIQDGFHRICHCGLLANSHRQLNLDLCRSLLDVPSPEQQTEERDAKQLPLAHRRLSCDEAMTIVGAWTPDPADRRATRTDGSLSYHPQRHCNHKPRHAEGRRAFALANRA